MTSYWNSLSISVKVGARYSIVGCQNCPSKEINKIFRFRLFLKLSIVLQTTFRHGQPTRQLVPIPRYRQGRYRRTLLAGFAIGSCHDAGMCKDRCNPFCRLCRILISGSCVKDTGKLDRFHKYYFVFAMNSIYLKILFAFVLNNRLSWIIQCVSPIK